MEKYLKSHDPKNDHFSKKDLSELQNMKTLLGPGFYNVSFEGNEKSAPSYSFANEVGKKAIEDNNSDYERGKQMIGMDKATGHRPGS